MSASATTGPTTTTTTATATEPPAEPLSTGWEPDVPEQDTAVRRYLFAWARMCEAFARAAGGTTVGHPPLLIRPPVGDGDGVEDDRRSSVVGAGLARRAGGRGHWLAHAVHRLRHAPDHWTAGVFSDYGRLPAERLGFVPVLRFTLWTRHI